VHRTGHKWVRHIIIDVKIDMNNKTTTTQNVFRILLAVFMTYAGFSHLTFNRMDFQAQVPDWLPLSKDLG
jgi:uncharacterized membrane protein